MGFMEVSSHLRNAARGDHVIAQARSADQQRIERIAVVRDATIVAIQSMSAEDLTYTADHNDNPGKTDIVNFVLEKCR